MAGDWTHNLRTWFSVIFLRGSPSGGQTRDAGIVFHQVTHLTILIGVTLNPRFPQKHLNPLNKKIGSQKSILIYLNDIVWKKTQKVIKFCAAGLHTNVMTHQGIEMDGDLELQGIECWDIWLNLDQDWFLSCKTNGYKTLFISYRTKPDKGNHNGFDHQVHRKSCNHFFCENYFRFILLL